MAAGKPYHHGNLRSTLLKAALDLIGQQGSHGFTLREVARRAQVSHTAPYRHFHDKDELLAAIAEDGFIRLSASLQSAAAQDWEPLRRLRNACVAYVAFALDWPEQFGVMFSLDLEKDRHPAAHAAAEGSFEFLVSLVRACHSHGLMCRHEPAAAARVAWAQAHGIAELTLRGRLGLKDRKEILEFATMVTDTLQLGMEHSLIPRE